MIESGATEVVALTLGADGGLLATRNEALYAPALKIETSSAVGAGDSFLGASVWALSQGHDPIDAFRYGMAAGAAALLSPGTELCQAADVMRLYPEVSLISI